MKQLYFTIVFLACVIAINGQGRGMNAISSAGGSMETKGLIVNWTIGEDLIDFALLDAAMRQPPGNKPNAMEMKDGTLLKVYPTLTTGLVTIEIRAAEQAELKIEFLDLKGSLLKVIKVDTDKLEIDLSDCVQGGYILRISNRMPTDQVNVKITKV
jgi:hypothetical protein